MEDLNCLKLGVIGGTGPESTLAYYKEIEQEVCKAMGGRFFPPMCIESLSVFRVLDYCKAGDLKGLSSYLLSGIISLAAAGCTLAAFTGITPHIAFEEVSMKSPIPILGIPGAVCDEMEERGLSSALVLGTVPTMREGFFKDALKGRGIRAVVPDEPSQERIGRIIEGELELGVVRDGSAEAIRAIAEDAAAKSGAQAVVLGCTELPLIWGRTGCALPAVDAMRCHICALCKAIENSMEH